MHTHARTSIGKDTVENTIASAQLFRSPNVSLSPHEQQLLGRLVQQISEREPAGKEAKQSPCPRRDGKCHFAAIDIALECLLTARAGVVVSLCRAAEWYMLFAELQAAAMAS